MVDQHEEGVQKRTDRAVRVIPRSDFYSETEERLYKPGFCKKCGSSLSKLNPYYFCNVCIGKAEAIIWERWNRKRIYITDRGNFNRNTSTILRVAALKLLGTTKTRRPLKVKQSPLSKKMPGQVTPDEWAWGDRS